MLVRAKHDTGLFITKDKVYDVIAVKEDSFLVENDDGNKVYYPIYHFEIVNETEVPEEVEEDFFDPVEHPKHYIDGGIEPIEYINSHNMNFNIGNIIKYASRYMKKGKPIEDLKKVIQYAKFEIERLEEESYTE